VTVVPFLISVVPSVGVTFLFWAVIRALFQADRRERAAQARIEVELDAARTAGGKGSPAASTRTVDDAGRPSPS
jgi:hypothetical protein